MNNAYINKNDIESCRYRTNDLCVMLVLDKMEIVPSDTENGDTLMKLLIKDCCVLLHSPSAK